MPAKTAFPLLAFAVLVGPLAAQPAAKPADDKVLVTKVYTVKPLIGERGKASGATEADAVVRTSNVADVDALVKLIFQTFPELRESKSGPDGPQIVERDGGKLEIRATAKQHEDVKELFEALTRLQDIAIDVKADVIELDVAAYEKLVKALPKGKASPVLFTTGAEFEEKEDPAWKVLAEVNKILKAGRVVQTSSGRFANGAEATVSARRTVVTFDPTGGAKGVKASDPDAMFVKEGFALVAVPVVSADRRFVRFKLTEQSTAIAGMRKRDLGEVGGQKIVMQSLDTEDLGATGSAVVADGGTVLFRLAYAPKDKVWVVVLKPTIFIQAEEDEIKKQEKK